MIRFAFYVFSVLEYFVLALSVFILKILEASVIGIGQVSYELLLELGLRLGLQLGLRFLCVFT